MGDRVQVWMVLDPETERVTMQDREFGDGSLPRGRRGRGWRHLRAKVSETEWRDLLEGRMSPEEQDAFHQAAWDRGHP